jgi:uncharacterized membrane protein
VRPSSVRMVPLPRHSGQDSGKSAASIRPCPLQRGQSANSSTVSSWTFTHTIFAIHYAHEYYTGPDDDLAQGLEFPGHGAPDYWDFVYYSFVIGTACATADVNVTSKSIRRITTLHCVVAFFFNTTILALTVNIGAGFF